MDTTSDKILDSDLTESNSRSILTLDDTNQNELNSEKREEKEITETNEDTNQEDFSSEKYKIEVKNLPSCFGYANLRKFFNGLNLKFVKIKAPQSSNFAFLTFANEEARQEAIKLINNTKYKGKQLEAVVSVFKLNYMLKIFFIFKHKLFFSLPSHPWTQWSLSNVKIITTITIQSNNLNKKTI